MFSARTAWDLEESPLAAAHRRRLLAGEQVFDLTISNPTRCGFHYDPALLAPLSDDRALLYDPAPFGILSACEAVSAYYRDHHCTVDPARICLTTSTSEAYSFLFRLLCDPGDEILIAQPSYPLFDFLAVLDDVSLVPYPLFYDGSHWAIEPGSLEARITGRTRAIVVVHPNNPTGHFTGAADRALLAAVCSRHTLALIVDEVFLDYPLSGPPALSFAHGEQPALTFVLSGLSKIAALPQMKAAWIAIGGPEALSAEAAARLEMIADTFLSMNAPVQHALPAWLASRGSVQAEVGARTRANLAELDRLLSRQAMVTRLAAEAGWYAILRVPAIEPDDDLALRLLDEAAVLVHPGSAFGFATRGMLAVSLLARPEDFREGVERIIRMLSAAYS